MAATIKIKNSSTAGAAPTSSDLVQGELAVNVTDKRLYTENASGTVVELGTNPSVPVTFPDGSASAPSLTNDGDTNTGIFFPAADTVGIATGGTERARVDSSGNLGLGVTPSAWVSGSKAFQLGAYTALSEATGGDTNLTDNSYLSAVGTYRSIITAPASRYQLDFGVHKWLSAASVTAGSVQTFTQAMTLDASGNLLVGATSQNGTSSRLYIKQSGDDTFKGVNIVSAASQEWLGSISVLSSGILNIAQTYLGGSGSYQPITFTTGGSERARIDSSGNLLVGTTSTGGVGGISIRPNLGGAGTYGRIEINQNQNADGVSFRYNGTEVGRINIGSSSTTYVTSSDYRLKENVAAMTGALDAVASLKPCTYTWKSTNEVGQGFIAHELAEVCPQAVVGEKDAVDENGNPKYQGIDTSFLVATLTAALQEAHGLIKDLQTRITVLENK